MITLNLYWWFLPVILFILPVIYAKFRTSGGTYDFQIDTTIILFACWGVAIGIIIGRFF